MPLGFGLGVEVRELFAILREEVDDPVLLRKKGLCKYTSSYIETEGSAVMEDEKENLPDLCFFLFGRTFDALKAPLIFALPATDQTWLTSFSSWIPCLSSMRRYPLWMSTLAHSPAMELAATLSP
jgi:hypothetical protein